MLRKSLLENNREKIFFVSFIFISSILFFTTIHPITIISGDDWSNLSLARPAYPMWKGFNPIKVLPEILMPYSGFIASFVIKPLGGTSYLFSLSLITALLLSTLLAIFFYQFYIFFTKTLNSDRKTTTFIGLIFFISLFGAFKSRTDSYYLLWEINLTCYYNYVIPALMNSAFVLYLSRKDIKEKLLTSNSYFFWSCILLTSYLCIFSNIFHNIILLIFCSLTAAINIINRKPIKSCYFYLAIIFAWIIAAFFEINGGRASGIGNHTLFIKESIVGFINFLKETNKTYRSLFILTMVFGFIFTFISEKKEENYRNFLLFFWMSNICCFMSWILLIFISSKSSADYVERPAAMWGFYMYAIMASCIAADYFFKRFGKAIILLPILTLILLSKALFPNYSLKESHNMNLTYSRAYEITNNIIEQVKDADKKGLEEMTLRVPKTYSSDNWPFPVYMGTTVSETLKADGIINQRIKIIISPSEELNREFNIPKY